MIRCLVLVRTEADGWGMQQPIGKNSTAPVTGGPPTRQAHPADPSLRPEATAGLQEGT